MRGELPDWVGAARARWRFRGQERPAFAATPGPGQESVWDYPRPPRIEADPREVVVRTSTQLLARTRDAVRVLETGGPPTLYLPPAAIQLEMLEPAPGVGVSRCEWKGEARYWRRRGGGGGVEPVAWSYPDPLPGFEALCGWLAFYPARVVCQLGAVPVSAQPGGFYGGWVTPELVGPFKGEAGSEDW